MGSGYSRSLGNSVLTANDIESGVIPHNSTISLILRAGVIGLIAFVLLYFRLAKALLADRRNRSPHRVFHVLPGNRGDAAGLLYSVLRRHNPGRFPRVVRDLRLGVGQNWKETSFSA